MREICYLHGFIERRDGNIGTEKYVSFFADKTTQDAEREAFAKALGYIREKNPSALYFYSKYERTIWRGLSKRYPNVAIEADIEKLFTASGAVDLYYDVVKLKTEWPTRDLSIKTIASFLGFKWRDEDPSGASSIEWYNRWVETGDLQIKQRILDYNEDDCTAMRYLTDAIRTLSRTEEYN
jgi:predicted RecB family nuclease